MARVAVARAKVPFVEGGYTCISFADNKEFFHIKITFLTNWRAWHSMT